MTAYTGAIVMKDALVKFGATTYTNQCTKAILVPDTPSVSQRTLVPDGVVTDTDSTVWTLEVEGLQDWETGGLAAYFNTNSGSLITTIIAPKVGSGKAQATVSVRIAPVEFGGEQGKFAMFDAKFEVQGAPTFGAQA